VGYEVSPQMAQLSRVNMYLHKFLNPKIYEYDTLTSEERWEEKFDIIMANPPFMTPKGGIQPHNKFSVQAKRSEVLFVDYIAEHLNPRGRAGVIVPEGIVFKNENAYKQLRKMLLEENYLYAVVSLPAGVFQPYSGVKTSILFFDKELAKKTDDILFAKVENDGYELGATRKEIDKNDLPAVMENIKKYQEYLRSGEKDNEFIEYINNRDKDKEKLKVYDKYAVVAKEKIIENDYNLSAERYREEADYSNVKWPMVKLDDILNFKGKGLRPASFASKNGKFDFIVSSPFKKKCDEADYETEALIVGDGGGANIHYINGKFSSSDHTYILENKDKNNVLLRYVYFLIVNNLNLLEKGFKGQSLKNLSKKYIKSIEIPLPPLEEQEKIVEELDRYQKIIDGAQQVIDNYQPTIKINSEWERVELGEICEIVRGGSPRPISNYLTNDDNGINWIKIGDVKEGKKYIIETKQKIKPEGTKKTRLVKEGDFILSNSMSFGRPYIVKIDGAIHDGWLLIRIIDENKVNKDFLYLILGDKSVKEQYQRLATGGVVKNLNSDLVKKVKIPLPPQLEQEKIVKQIEQEQQLVDRNQKLIQIFQQKIQDKINDIWGK
jgi:type I restriction enzyme M protein